jgi:hypothetical protein
LRQTPRFSLESTGIPKNRKSGFSRRSPERGSKKLRDAAERENSHPALRPCEPPRLF